MIGGQVIRACTHLDVSRDEIEYTAGVIREIEPAHDLGDDFGVLRPGVVLESPPPRKIAPAHTNPKR